ncbi:hypothetical protein IEN85_14235 [Pelagicoccus sp. NFK12]|uniref:Uncharacterized protein n=1 Tax=Pelagicoccus enzymogenes TaxID=2773457 RepID=A0A927IG03_9BACT|nr:hypothetical protein [Pelagicoccus enzymogenes]MBD5780657.1 hypothetical protein [Pelagicoccus enzymogenes]MDQ8198942.1 hypothetical protein [Pelagicoccus enzymogenes]
MSHIALGRGLKVLHYLVQHGSARFKDLSVLLDPVSPASQMRLLQTLINLGEIEKVDNQYRLSSNSFFGVASSNDPFAIKAEEDAKVTEIIRSLARNTSYSAGLFGWVTPGTMVILNTYSPIGSERRYRPAGQEWPLVPFHDFSQLFLAYTPEYYQEDAFFRWNLYLNDEYKIKDFDAFLTSMNSIREKGYRLSEEIKRTYGSFVMPVFVHEESMPRFALGVLVHDNPSDENLEKVRELVAQGVKDVAAILKDNITPKQLEMDAARLRKVVRYNDPTESED